MKRFMWLFWVLIITFLSIRRDQILRVRNSDQYGEVFQVDASGAESINLRDGVELSQSFEMVANGLSSVRFPVKSQLEIEELLMVELSGDGGEQETFAVDSSMLNQYSLLNLDVADKWDELERGSVVTLHLSTNSLEGVEVYVDENKWFLSGTVGGDLMVGEEKLDETLVLLPEFGEEYDKNRLVSRGDEIRDYIAEKDVMLWVKNLVTLFVVIYVFGKLLDDNLKVGRKSQFLSVFGTIMVVIVFWAYYLKIYL